MSIANTKSKISFDYFIEKLIQIFYIRKYLIKNKKRKISILIKISKFFKIVFNLFIFIKTIFAFIKI